MNLIRIMFKILIKDKKKENADRNYKEEKLHGNYFEGGEKNKMRGKKEFNVTLKCNECQKFCFCESDSINKNTSGTIRFYTIKYKI